MEHKFEEIINLIKGVREEHEEMLLIKCGDIEFLFNKSFNPRQIDETLNRFELPIDYRAFLENYSSARLFKDSYYGGGYEILSPQNVIEYWKAYSIDHPYYPIAWSSHSLGCICVDQDRINSGNGYLTWIQSMDPENPIDINLSFSEWLKEVIEKNGVEFWI